MLKASTRPARACASATASNIVYVNADNVLVNLIVGIRYRKKRLLCAFSAPTFIIALEKFNSVMKTRLVPTLAAAGVLLASSALVTEARAQAVTPNPLLPVAGTREIELRGQFIFDPSESQSVHLGYGPFLNPNVQIGGSVDYAHSNGGSSIYGGGLFVNYHFPSASPLLPFIGLNLGYSDGNKGIEGSFAYGVQGGAKYFLTQNVAVTGTLLYRDFSKNGFQNDLNFNFGLAVYLR